MTLYYPDLTIEKLTGVGPKIGAKLNRLGIETLGDLIFYFPRCYEDYTKITPIGEIPKFLDRGFIDTSTSDFRNSFTVRCTLRGIANKKTRRRGFTVTEGVATDESGSLKVVWFNQPFLVKMLHPGSSLILHGKVSYDRFSNDYVMESPNRATKPKIVPIYPVTAGLSTYYIAKLIEGIKSQIKEIEDYLPANILSKNELPDLKTALLNIHLPESSDLLDKARRRLAFEELFFISLESNLTKAQVAQEMAPKIKIDLDKIKKFIALLPYELTGDQKKAVWQILKDIEQDRPMNRLLNGDVGSGKTVVALIATYAAVLSGYRVAVMAPTEILAKQHYGIFCKLLGQEEVSVGLMTANSKEYQEPNIKDQKQISKTKIIQTKPEQAQIVIGTQALLQKKVNLENLGLVIVDEQHRFGVEQRKALKDQRSNIKYQKDEPIIKNVPTSNFGRNADLSLSKIQLPTSALVPHFLSMTATPIPRTLHLALFGDLDFTVIKEKPANRKEIKTRFVEPINREKAYSFIRRQIEAGRQAFVICPLIEEDLEVIARKDMTKQSLEDRHAAPAMTAQGLFEQDRKSVVKEYEKLQKVVFPDLKIGMLHGKMKSKEKDEIMGQFSSGRLDILVSTSVVEVGVDIPNASVMMIEDAERFGLAQIHQFRGRVGRGEHQSFCFLFSNSIGDKVMERLQSLEAISDGFKLAEIDLKMRGPGAVFGTEQSGMLDLKMADFSDTMLIEEAAEAAKEVSGKIEQYPHLKEKLAKIQSARHLE